MPERPEIIGKKVISINLANDFSRAPAGRFRTDGRYSGEAFRQDLLIPKLHSGAHLKIVFDGARNPGSSFLEEAFGGLIRFTGLTSRELHERMEIVSRRASISKEIWEYIDDPRSQIT